MPYRRAYSRWWLVCGGPARSSRSMFGVRWHVHVHGRPRSCAIHLSYWVIATRAQRHATKHSNIFAAAAAAAAAATSGAAQPLRCNPARRDDTRENSRYDMTFALCALWCADGVGAHRRRSSQFGMFCCRCCRRRCVVLRLATGRMVCAS